MDESAIISQEIGEVSHRWSFEQWDEKLDELDVVEDGGSGGLGGFVGVGSGVFSNEVINDTLVYFIFNKVEHAEVWFEKSCVIVL